MYLPSKKEKKTQNIPASSQQLDNFQLKQPA